MVSWLPTGLQEQVALGPHCTLGTGGPARYLLRAESDSAVVEALSWAREQALHVVVLGGGSNVVITDDAIDALVLQVANRGIDDVRGADGIEVTAAAGEDWDALVAFAVARDWAGIECLSGIPGRVGATPIQNVGAYGQEVSDTLVRVRCLDRTTLAVATFSRDECRLAYRDSRFKREDRDRYVVLDVTFRLSPGGIPRLGYGDLLARVGPNPTLAEVRSAVLAARAEKSMLIDRTDPNGRSCGSFFVNPVVSRETFERLATTTFVTPPHYPEPNERVKVPAAWLIEQSGFKKGMRAGAVGISSKHALAIVAHEGARSADVRALALTIKNGVRERFGIALEAEPRFVGLPPP